MAYTTRENDPRVTERLAVLLRTNLNWLRQARALVETTPDAALFSAPRALPKQKAASHLRHILEFYECFLNGLDTAHIDYDARRRDASLERSRTAVLQRIDSLIRSLDNPALRHGDGAVWVRMEDVDPDEVRDGYLMSTVSRELQVLSSHTVHHFALIAVTLLAHGVPVNDDFGMAPSTLRFQAEKRELAVVEAA